MCDHLLGASIKTIKYLNGPLGGLIGPHISPWIHFENADDSVSTLAGDGLIINLSWGQASHDNSLD